MSAIVTSPEDHDWYTNSRSWSIILDQAMRELAPAERDEFVKHAGPIGLNFRFVDEPQRTQVAGWLLRAVEALSGPEAAGQGWDDENNRAHLAELAVMLRPMTKA
jgi:hypothetical protein